jgi:hypothetical protein
LSSYKVRVVDEAGLLVAGATLQCIDDKAACVRFEGLPLPPGYAELRQGSRLVAHRTVAALSQHDSRHAEHDSDLQHPHLVDLTPRPVIPRRSSRP